MTTPTKDQLRSALTVRLQIDRLEKRLASIAKGFGNGFTNGSTRGGSRHMSADARERIATAQRKRWAAWRKQKDRR